MTKHLHLKIEEKLLIEFEKKIEELKQNPLQPTINKSVVMRELIIKFIKS